MKGGGGAKKDSVCRGEKHGRDVERKGEKKHENPHVG